MTESLGKQLPELLTVPEAADFLRISPRTIERMLTDGRLVRMSGGTARVLIPRQSVLDVLQVIPPTKGVTLPADAEDADAE